MTSILTNTSAMSSLQNLATTQRQLSKTQAQISSGLAVATASDNAAYWSIAKTMSAHVTGLKAVNESLALTNSIADVTAAALVSIKTSLQKMQDDIVTAGQSGVSQSAVQSDIVAQQQSILAVANSASFNGVNWLTDHTSTNTTMTIVGTSSVSASDLQAIALGSEPAGSQSVYHSTTTTTTSVTDGASTRVTTSTVGQTVTKTDRGDGTVDSPQPVADQPTFSTSGSIDGDTVIVPSSLSGSGGLMTTSFSLIPLTLFSSDKGTTTRSVTVSYGGGPPQTLQSSSSSSDTNSYDGYGGGSSGGILDGLFVVTDNSPQAATPSGNQPSTPTYVFDPISGGNVLQTSSAPGAGGAPSTQLIQENMLTLSVVGTSSSDLATMATAVQLAISNIIVASTSVGSLQTRISNQMSFNSALSDALTSGVGSLVDADMNVASTRLQALQTQQQLGIQALSVANQDSQLILKLFQAA